MWAYIVMSLVVGYIETGDFKAHPRDSTEFDFEIGQHFNELSPESVELLHTSKHYDKDNSIYFSSREAPNTDGCFLYNNSCQPDWVHHIYLVPMREHPEYTYKITFSYNWRILNIENNYSHG